MLTHICEPQQVYNRTNRKTATNLQSLDRSSGCTAICPASSSIICSHRNQSLCLEARLRQKIKS